MSVDGIVPIITSIGWLILVGSALASYRLAWSKLARLGLTWLAIFIGLYLIVTWFSAG